MKISLLKLKLPSKTFMSADSIILWISFFSILNNGVLEYFHLRIYLYIALLYFIRKPTFKGNIFKSPLLFEMIYWILLYCIIVIIFPFNDIKFSERTYLQTFDGRFWSQVFRFFLEIIASIYFVNSYNKNPDIFNKILLAAANFTIAFAFIDILFLNKIFYNLLVGATYVGNRFTAFNIEPRMFGLILVYVYAFLMIQNVRQSKLLFIIGGIFYSLSVSSIIIFSIVFLYFNRRNLQLLLPVIIIFTTLIIYFIIPNAKIIAQILPRFEQLITVDGQNDFAPFFSVLEVFDRSALNALFNNKEYLFIGFGPNTISIPASYYIPDRDINTYEGILNSPPHTGIINIISRSGLFYFLIFIWYFFRKKNRIFVFIYLIQYNFIFYSFYNILFSNRQNENKEIDNE